MPVSMPPPSPWPWDCDRLDGREAGEAGGGDWAGRKLFCAGGGGVTRKPIFPTPPPSLLGRRDGRGGSGRGCPTCRAGGGGGQPNIYGSK